MIFSLNLRKFIKTLMKFHENPWKSMKFYEISWYLQLYIYIYIYIPVLASRGAPGSPLGVFLNPFWKTKQVFLRRAEKTPVSEPSCGSQNARRTPRSFPGRMVITMAKTFPASSFLSHCHGNHHGKNPSTSKPCFAHCHGNHHGKNLPRSQFSVQLPW